MQFAAAGRRVALIDLSAATRRGYRYDLPHFIAWYTGLYVGRQAIKKGL